jgi:hypothetical protein
MKKVLFLIMACALFACPSVRAADTVDMFGVPNSSGVAPMSVDTDRMITIAPSAGVINSYELATTNDTLTAVDCGKTFIVTEASQTTFVLPDANVGCKLTFTSTTGASTKKFILNPQDTDYFRGVVNSSAANTFAVGDSVISPGNTGDSITIFCGEDLYWDVVQKTGTFVDAN